MPNLHYFSVVNHINLHCTPFATFLSKVLLMLDATAGVTEQDRVLAQRIADDGRACVIVCNKWDAVVDKDSTTYDKSVKFIREELPQVRWAPILFISAATGQRVGKVYGAIDDAIQAHRKRISTSILNEVLRDAVLWQVSCLFVVHVLVIMAFFFF